MGDKAREGMKERRMSSHAVEHERRLIAEMADLTSNAVPLYTTYGGSEPTPLDPVLKKMREPLSVRCLSWLAGLVR